MKLNVFFDYIMKRLFSIKTILFIILPIVCWFLQPSLSDLDYVSLDCTIFGVSLALITFLLPSMSSFRNKLMEFDEQRIKNNSNQINTLSEILQSHQDNKEIANLEFIRVIDEKISKMIGELSERVKNPEFISDTITNMFSGFESLACKCVFSIVILVISQEVIFTSDTVCVWCKSIMLNVFSEETIMKIYYFAIAYIKLSSLSLQLIFLYLSCQNVFQWVRLVKFSENQS